MSIVVIRHGNTELNTARVFQPYSTPLSKDGVAQAKACGEWLAKEFVQSKKVIKLLTSDLLRTKQTTELILAALPIDVSSQVIVVESQLLRERDFGELKGKSYSEAPKELFEGELRSFQPPGGESWDTFDARVKKAWSWVLEHVESSLTGKEEECIVVVTHGLVKKHMAMLWHEGEARSKQVSFENTSVSMVSASAPHTIALFGSVQHLAKF